VGIVEAALAAIEERDWDRLEPILHPYVHWQTADGEAIRGRRNVLAKLPSSPTPVAPGSCELRDGQIYRWTDG
jgi:hypothetical protein